MGTVSTPLNRSANTANLGQEGKDAARNGTIRIQYDSGECNLVKRNTNINISTEVINSTNTR